MKSFVNSDLFLPNIYLNTGSAVIHTSILECGILVIGSHTLPSETARNKLCLVRKSADNEQPISVTYSLVNIKNETISIDQCSEPTKEVKIIYDLLKYKYAPFV